MIESWYLTFLRVNASRLYGQFPHLNEYIYKQLRNPWRNREKPWASWQVINHRLHNNMVLSYDPLITSYQK